MFHTKQRCSKISRSTLPIVQIVEAVVTESSLYSFGLYKISFIHIPPCVLLFILVCFADGCDRAKQERLCKLVHPLCHPVHCHPPSWWTANFGGGNPCPIPPWTLSLLHIGTRPNVSITFASSKSMDWVCSIASSAFLLSTIAADGNMSMVHHDPSPITFVLWLAARVS